ncbi:MAG: hypothetical protein AAF752_05395 [Bacteroidota bacterium]
MMNKATLFFALLLAPALVAAQPVDESLRITGAGLASYGVVKTEYDEIPCTITYLRGADWKPEYYWRAVEPQPGVYDFSPFLVVMDEAASVGSKVGFRMITHHPGPRTFPSWVKTKSITRNGYTMTVPDWADPGVKAALRDLTLEMGRQLGDHPAFLFADIGLLGFSGEWHTEHLGFEDTDFMPSLDIMYEYVDMHIDAFGAENLVLNLGMEREIIVYALEHGVNGWRHDGFGAWTKNEILYPARFNAIPALWDVTGVRMFEIWGRNISDWPEDDIVQWTTAELFDEASKYGATIFANMGNGIPDRDKPAYKAWHRAMMAAQE